MPETAEDNNDFAVESPVPEPVPKTAWQRVQEWLFAALVLFIVSGAVDVSVKLFSAERVDCTKLNSELAKKVCEEDQRTTDSNHPSWATKLRDGNSYVIESVNSLDPFNFAAIIYHYLWDGIPPKPEAWYSFAQPLPQALDIVIIKVIYRAIPGAIYTALAVASHSWLSIITTLIALYFGYLVHRYVWRGNDAGHELLSWLLVPLIGGVFIWVLIQVMSLSSYLLGRFLSAPETQAALSVLGTTVWAMFKKTENDSTDKFIKWSKAFIFK